MPSSDHPGHFMTYLETENCGKFDHQRDLFHVGKCSICVNWWFSSKAEIKRHRRIMHPRIPISKLLINQRNTNHNQPDAKLHICRHNNCGQSFTTYHKLLVLKNCTGQKKNRKRRAKESKESENKEVKKKKHREKKSGHSGQNAD